LKDCYLVQKMFSACACPRVIGFSDCKNTLWRHHLTTADRPRLNVIKPSGAYLGA